MLKPYFSEEISDRQAQVLAHIMANTGATFENLHYIKSEEYLSDIFPIDIAVHEPTEFVDYYIAHTVGLSSYYFTTNFARSELVMLLPKTWKPVFDREEYKWPLGLLLDIAYGIVENKVGPMIGQVYMPNGNEIVSPATDAIGGIITLAEHFPIELYEVKINDTFTRFFQVVPITKDDAEKIEENGSIDFIKYNLHDSEGPQMVVKLKEKKPMGIDKLIKQNEDSLKSKSTITIKKK
jgi:hypothetical protein